MKESVEDIRDKVAEQARSILPQAPHGVGAQVAPLSEQQLRVTYKDGSFRILDIGGFLAVGNLTDAAAVWGGFIPARASGLASPTVLPAATLPCRPIAPAANSRLSARLVFPAPPGPTIATNRVPALFSGMLLSLRSRERARVE